MVSKCRDDLEIYCSEVQKLCFTIISQMEKALKIESNEVTELSLSLS